MYIVASLAFFLLFSLLGRLASLPGSAPGASGDAAAAVARGATAAALPTVDSNAAAPEEASVHITLDDDGSLSCNLVDKDLPPAMRQRLVDACERMESDNGAFGRAFVGNLSAMLMITAVMA